MKKIIVFIFLLLLSCSTNSSQLDYSTVHSILVNKNKQKLVYFWTNWCKSSQQQLLNVILPLHGDSQINSLYEFYIICADNNNRFLDSLRENSDSSINFYSIMLNKKSALFPFQSRMAIKMYTDSLSSYYSSLLTGNFLVPQSLILSKENEYISHGIGSDLVLAKKLLIKLSSK